MPELPKLLDHMRSLIRPKHLSYNTERACVAYIREYIPYHGKRHPREMGVDQIRDYLTYMAMDKKVAASTQNVGFSPISLSINRS